MPVNTTNFKNKCSSNIFRMESLCPSVWFRSSRPEVFCKKMFLKISQSSQENTCARVSFLITLLKKRLWHRCFPVNFVKFLRTPFLTELLRWLLLLIDLISSVRLVWLRELLRLEEKKILILHKQSECGNSLKLDSHLPKIFFWFPSMIVPQKWWKMLFILS